MNAPHESPESAALAVATGGGWLAAIPKALVPASIKALDRLIGAGIDLPVAWLAQQEAKIDAQTQAFSLVEASIAKAAASQAEANPAIIERAVDVLVRKAYRQQLNKAAVSTAMIEDLQNDEPESAEKADANVPPAELDDDWLNVFERYAEDASTERMQRLWGRVLAGEIRSPGRYSTRTLRFLSEFSQADAIEFSEFCKFCFKDIAPKKLVNPDTRQDIRSLIYLESSGLIQGASGAGLRMTLTFDGSGHAHMREGNLAIIFEGKVGQKIEVEILTLTPIGQELLTLLPSRDAKSAARTVANSMKAENISSALLATVGKAGQVIPMEILWQNPPSPTPTVQSGINAS